MRGARIPAPASLVSQPQVTSSYDIHVLHAPIMPQEQHMWAQPVWCQRALPHDLDHPLFLLKIPFLILCCSIFQSSFPQDAFQGLPRNKPW